MYKNLSKAAAKPAVWSKYTADVLWTDAHIAQQMLNFHLNPDLSLASRTAEFIDASAQWLVSEFNLGERSKVIDFGCGPGLYTHHFKTSGVGTVVGLDFSENSLAYAKNQAKEAGFEIEYRLGNYLDFEDQRQFDLITMVMCDLCALNPDQRSTLLANFKSLLAPNGHIALDVYTAHRFNQQGETLSLERNAMNGFWSGEDYWCIQSSFTYQDEQLTLDKYVINQENKEWTVYNWLQHFTLEQLAHELNAHGLEIKHAYSDLKGTPFIEGDEMAVVIGHQS